MERMGFFNSLIYYIIITGDYMIMQIKKLDYEGRGIAKEENKVIFVPRALINEVVKTKVLKRNKSYEIHTIEEIIEKSPQRVESYCPFASKCGGCSYDIISYEDSLKYKKEGFKELLTKNHIDISDIQIIPSHPSKNYRNKITLKVKKSQFGYYKEESHEFVPIKNCLLASPCIQNLLKDFSLLGLAEGEVTVRSNKNQELLLHLKSEKCPDIKEELINKHKIAGIIWNNQVIYNNPFFFMRRNKILYKVRYSSFFQVNEYISEKIKEEVLKNLNEKDRVLDLYCGVGFFSLPIAKKVEKVTGIEYNSQAIVDALYNASLNQIQNTTFHAGRVEDILKSIPKSYNVVVLDPPRAGLDKKVREILNREKYKKIIYISCNPFTLVRDLKELKSIYQIEQIKLYDMFAYTKHIESMTIMTLKKESR